MPLVSQTLIPLMSGAYQARNAIANYLLCENLFPEQNIQEASPDVPVTHYPREGKRFLSACPTPGVGRGVFSASNGMLYAFVGVNVYSISQTWVWTLVGSLQTPLATPVSMADNGTTAVIVDGTAFGYQITLASNAFSPISDSTGSFVGATRADYADSFLGFNAPGTQNWYVSLSNQVAFNALANGSKNSAADPIATFGFNLRQAWLIGQKSTEIWFLAGSTPFPYQEWPNSFVPYGCTAPYSLVQAGMDLFWLSSNPQGQLIAVKTAGLKIEPISTRALEYLWTNYPASSDCIGSTFQQAGHTFVIFNFPTADATWAYDLATKEWHSRNTIDGNGVKHRESTTFYASVGAVKPNNTIAGTPYPQTIVGQDWANGQIYALDPLYYTDNGTDIAFLRTFPHQMMDMKEITHASFVADFAAGGAPGLSESDPNPPQLAMRYSNDGGNTFGNYRLKGLLTSGNYRSLMRWRGLGMARDRVYELSWVYPGPSALQGAYLEPIPHSA